MSTKKTTNAKSEDTKDLYAQDLEQVEKMTDALLKMTQAADKARESIVALTTLISMTIKC